MTATCASPTGRTPLPMRRRCNWCGVQAPAIGDEGARALGWLVGWNAMCPGCAGPLVCARLPGEGWRCEDCPGVGCN